MYWKDFSLILEYGVLKSQNDIALQKARSGVFFFFFSFPFSTSVFFKGQNESTDCHPISHLVWYWPYYLVTCLIIPVLLIRLGNRIYDHFHWQV